MTKGLIVGIRTKENVVTHVAVTVDQPIVLTVEQAIQLCRETGLELFTVDNEDEKKAFIKKRSDTGREFFTTAKDKQEANNVESLPEI